MHYISHLASHHIISSTQYGFMPGFSVETQIIDYLNQIYSFLTIKIVNMLMLSLYIFQVRLI